MPITDQIQQMVDLLTQMNTAMKANVPVAGAMASAKKKLKDEEEKLLNVMDKSKAVIIAQSNEVKKAAKKISDYEALLKSASAGVSKFSDNVRKSQDALNKMQSGMQKGFSSVTGTIGKLTGALGIAGISFNSIVKAGLEYNRSLFEVSRSQQVAGKRANDLSIALDYVSKNTVLSRQQFIKLANEIQSSFLGLKPSLIETAQLVENIGEQFGYSYETQSKAAQSLMAIQNKQPALYDRIKKGMDAVADASKKGVVTGSIIKESEALKNRIALTALATDMDRSSLEFALQAVSVKSEAQNKLMQIEKASAEARKAMEDVQLKFYESLQPLIIKATEATSSLINVTSDYTGVIAGTVGAFVLLKAASPFLAITAGAGKAAAATTALKTSMMGIITPLTVGIGLIVAEVMGAVIAFQGLHNERKKDETIMKKQRDNMKLMRGMQIDLKKLTKEQLVIYNKEWDVKKKQNMTVEDIVNLHDEIITKTKLETDAGYKNAQEYLKTKQAVEIQLQIINKIIESLNTQIGLASEFGAVNKEALNNAVTYSKLMVEEFMPKMKAGIDAVKNSLKDVDIKLNITPSDDPDIISKKLMEAREKLNKLPTTNKTQEDNKQATLESIAYIQDLLNQKLKLEGNIVRANASVYMAKVEQLENASSAYESNLRTQMQIVQAAQFGMGPSLEMMQKMVNLDYKMMQVLDEQNKAYAESFISTKFVTEEQMKQIQNAALQGEAEEYINSIVDKRAPQYLGLIKYAKDYQVLTDKSYKKQLEIYELTKNIREGYLDAMREMSAGAGEFEKIIGTQEMGVTQLMNTVKNATGEFSANTMALGGMQTAQATGAGIGTETTGRYEKGTGNLKFINDYQQFLRNSRIKDYYKYIIPSEGGAPQVGSGVAAGQNEPQLRAIQQDAIDATAEGTEQGLINFYKGDGRDLKNNATDAVNSGVKKGSFNKGEVESIRKNQGWMVDKGGWMYGALTGSLPKNPSIPIPGAQPPTPFGDVLIRPGKEAIEFAPDDVIMGVKQHKVKKLGIKKVNDFGFPFSPFVANAPSPDSKETKRPLSIYEIQQTNEWLAKRKKKREDEIIRDELKKKRGESIRDELRKGMQEDILKGRTFNNNVPKSNSKEVDDIREEIARTKKADEKQKFENEIAEFDKILASEEEKKLTQRKMITDASGRLNAQMYNPKAIKYKSKFEMGKIYNPWQDIKRKAKSEFSGYSGGMTSDAFKAKHGFGTMGSLGGGKFSAGSLGGGKFSAGSLGGGKFSAGSLGGGKFSAGSLGGGKFSAGSLGGGKFSAGSLGGTKRQDNMAFAPSQEGSSGGATITINLGPGIQGQVDEAHGIAVQIANGSK